MIDEIYLTIGFVIGFYAGLYLVTQLTRPKKPTHIKT